ncbi:MAG: hypothetical protein LBC46_06090 [Treponema sp.]|jgi:hypothetical protein|nr:hypothetical protein [Treponema sp.]
MKIQRAFKARICPADEPRVFLNNAYESLKDSRQALRMTVNLRRLGEDIAARRGELRSVDMEALAFGYDGETAVEIPETGRSRNLVEQAERSAQATSPWL